MKYLFKHKPLGKGYGISPGKVVWVRDNDSVNWANDTMYWWELKNFNHNIIRKMFLEGLMSLTGTNTIYKAWDKIFKFHNKVINNLSIGYKSGQKIAIKVNMNGSGEWNNSSIEKSQMSYCNPVLIKEILKSLVKDFNVNPQDITVFDPSRIFPDYFKDYCSSNELSKVNFIDRLNAEADFDSPLRWSKKFSNHNNYFPKCLVEADYLINLANLKAHFWGVTLLAKNHFGTIMNKDRMRPPEYADIHQFVLDQNYGDYSVLTDLLINYQLGEKTILYIFDALIVAQTEGTNINHKNSKWKQEPFNDDFTKSLFLSQDPFALDSVGIDFLTNEPTIINYNRAPINRVVDNYLHQVEYLNSKYLNGNYEKPKIYGVHEHWNNPIDKKYSKNLGFDNGIELIYLDTKL